MKLDKFEKFIKMMALTTSPADGEALNALRKANAYLAEANIGWEELLRAKISITDSAAQTTYTGKKYTNADEIEEMLSGVLASLASNSSFRTFIESLNEWWGEKAFLTEKQYNALRKSYERIG